MFLYWFQSPFSPLIWNRRLCFSTNQRIDGFLYCVESDWCRQFKVLLGLKLRDTKPTDLSFEINNEKEIFVGEFCKVKKSGIIIAALLAFASLAQAQTAGKAVTVKAKHIVRTTAQIMAYEKAYGPKVPILKLKNTETEHEYYRGNLQSRPGAPATAVWPIPLNDVQTGPVTPKREDLGPMFTVPVNFAGPDLGSSGFIPPDSTGDVSLTSVIVAANGRIRGYDRLGNISGLNANATTFFSSLAPVGGVSDPRVVFDRLSGRWYIGIVDLAGTNNRILLAVSNNGLINAGTVWSFFAFNQNIGGGPNGFADYCTLGVDANGIYLGSNRFNGGFQNTDLYAVNKALLLQVGPVLQVTPFRNLCVSAGGTGMFTPWPCSNDDPAATTCIVVGIDNAVFSLMSYRRVSFAAGVFSITANATLGLPVTQSPLAMPNTPVTSPLDSLDDRIFNARVFRDRVTGAVTVHCAHNVRTNSAGVSGAGDRTAARWYNLGNVFSGGLSLTASGTVVDGGATPRFCTIPSTAMNGQGNQFIGFSHGNTANTAGVGGSYRVVGDSNLTAPSVVQPGGPSYAVQGAGTQRWGDYSVTCVDPRDMQSMWSFQEFINATNSWQVRAVKILGPGPTVSALAPNNGNQGQTLNVGVTGTGIFDPDGTYPDHLTFNFGANITVNSVTWTNATTASVNITIAAAAATGPRSITMTNPDGQSTTSTFTVNGSAAKTVSGVLTLNSYGGPINTLKFIYELRDSGTNALLETQTITGLGVGNTFSFNTTIAAGTYALRIKGINRFLAKSQLATLTATGASGLAYTLKNGDADGNNAVGVPDFNLLKLAFGSTGPNPPYNEATDFDGNNAVGVPDFNILKLNFGQTGDN